jgi:hypothetical protein
MTNSRRRGPKQPKVVPKGPLKKPRPVWFVTLMAFVLPGSGQVFNGAPARGVIFQFGMILGAFITYQLTTPEISPLGRMAGGLLVYVFSIVDANGIAKLRVKAWERIEAGQPPRPRRSSKLEAFVEGGPSDAHTTGVAASARRKKRPVGPPPADLGESAASKTGPGDSTLPEDGSGEPGGPGAAPGAQPAPSQRPSV